MNEIKKYSNKGLSGLVNFGNTCYVNSALQILNHIYEFNEYISNYNENYKLDDMKFIKEWIDLQQLMLRVNVVIAPKRFLAVLKILMTQKSNELGNIFFQNDTTEFIYFILANMHEELKECQDNLFEKSLQQMKTKYHKYFIEYYEKEHINDFSIIDELFGYYTMIQYVDQETGEIYSTRYERFYIFDLALTSTDLNECLKDHFKTEIMSEENNNAYYSDKYKEHKDVEKNSFLYHCPQYVIIQLKRWNMNMKKNQRIIHYDIGELDFEEFSCNKEQPTKYELFGIINHSGSMQGGHYISYVKNQNDKWYVYNDTSVEEIKPEKIIGNKNYCLVYRRK